MALERRTYTDQIKGHKKTQTATSTSGFLQSLIYPIIAQPWQIEEIVGKDAEKYKKVIHQQLWKN